MAEKSVLCHNSLGVGRGIDGVEVMNAQELELQTLIFTEIDPRDEEMTEE